jgi:hypothetical protein
MPSTLHYGVARLLHSERNRSRVLCPAAISRNRHGVSACRSFWAADLGWSAYASAACHLEQAATEHEKEETDAEKLSPAWLIQSSSAEQHGRDHQTERE